ncbi:HEXXH motif-containing putative peptide modification protein [Streptomyces sp. NPDC097619]|uniref:aKG-HExxH-type peptide beta-hydroxylase n=1 Tax=Streptomyces sp. NPDC097619 TaxID=3157228 RepID=UPI0033191C92
MRHGGTTGQPGPPAAPPVSEELLRTIGETEPSAEGTALLTSARRERRRDLLRRVLREAVRGGADGGPAPEHRALLDEAVRQAPEAVAAVLDYPATGVWAEETLHRLGDPAGPPPDLGHLGGVAVAAALRAGIAFTAVLKPVHGRIVLPTLGVLRPGRPGPQRLSAGCWDPADPAALPLHPLPGGATVLDDLDPYRVPGRPTAVAAARRLTPRGHKRWDVQWNGALTLLGRYDTARAEEAAGLLRSLVPLAGGAGEPGATLPEAPGAVFARGQAPPALAATLVREVQYGKLAALGTVVSLHTAGPAARHWAPWHPEPRPLEGLLRGAYAQLALAGYWQRAALYGARGAWTQHARHRTRVAAVLPGLAADPGLTAAGRVFTAAMARAERALDALPPPGEQYAAARRVLARERRAWDRAHPALAAP